MNTFFAVLGGMGSLATESYVRLVNKLTNAHCDQEYLDYVVFNDASVPDRTDFILSRSQCDPFIPLADDIAKATMIGASFITLPCNTAHYWFDRLQKLTPIPIMHMPSLTVAQLERRYPSAHHSRVGFMGTEGSLSSGIYRSLLEQAGYTVVLPSAGLQHRISELIYSDVKGTGRFDRQRYEMTLRELLDSQSCDSIMLGCTELSVLNESFPMPELPIIDAQEVLAQATVNRAQALRASTCEPQ